MASESLILAAGIRGIGHTRGPLVELAGTISAIAAPLWPVRPPLFEVAARRRDETNGWTKPSGFKRLFSGFTPLSRAFVDDRRHPTQPPLLAAVVGLRPSPRPLTRLSFNPIPEEHTHDLLAQAIAAHGGLDRWNTFKGVTATVVTGGG